MSGCSSSSTPASTAGSGSSGGSTDTGSSSAVDLLVKEIDLVALEKLVYGQSDYAEAASQAFQHVLRPYFNGRNESDKTAILNRIAFDCSEDRSDPTAAGQQLAFPVQLVPDQPGAAVWHRYACSFTIQYSSALGQSVSYSSPKYTINQFDLQYGTVNVEPATAFQNYNWGSAAAPSYPWLGRYVQSLNMMLRDNADRIPVDALAGVNGGYDYRVDAWEQYLPHDNICPPRYSPISDKHQFYTHPTAVQCPMVADGMPSCAQGDSLPVADDLGNALVYLAPAVRAKSWRSTPFQSYNCGGIGERNDRGALILYPNSIYTKRTSPSKDDVDQLRSASEDATSALGAGPLLIQDDHFVYDQVQSEEGMPIDNYEIGGAVGAGFHNNADGSRTLHIVNINGDDYSEGLHDWMLGLYFLSPYAASNGAVALGNGGDATFWVNPQAAAVTAVLDDPLSANNRFFKALFVNNGNPGIVSNCSGFATPPIQCRGRPVHDGLFVYSR